VPLHKTGKSSKGEITRTVLNHDLVTHKFVSPSMIENVRNSKFFPFQTVDNTVGRLLIIRLPTHQHSDTISSSCRMSRLWDVVMLALCDWEIQD